MVGEVPLLFESDLIQLTSTVRIYRTRDLLHTNKLSLFLFSREFVIKVKL